MATGLPFFETVATTQSHSLYTRILLHRLHRQRTSSVPYGKCFQDREKAINTMRCDKVLLDQSPQQNYLPWTRSREGYFMPRGSAVIALQQSYKQAKAFTTKSFCIDSIDKERHQCLYGKCLLDREELKRYKQQPLQPNPLLNPWLKNTTKTYDA